MDNRDIIAAGTYHDDTKHSEISIRSTPHFLDWPNQPLPFKLYRDLEPRPLPKELESLSMPALDTIAAAAAEPQGEREPDLNELARIFRFSAGITKTKTYAGGQILFRAAACTGALYHIELYLGCRELPGLEAGLYHFGPSDFGLRKLRDGDWRSVVVEASGDETSLVTAPAVVLFTSTFWRNSWKYRQRAYRHSFWDSGTLMANLLAEAASMELPARIIFGFRDDLINRLLDVDPHREVALGLVGMGRVSAPVGSGETTAIKTIPTDSQR